MMNKVPQETNGQFAEQNLTPHGSSLVLSQHSSLLVYSEAMCPHPFPHTRSCKRASSLLAYDSSSTAKKHIKEGTEPSFSRFFFAAELLYGTSFMVLCHVFIIPGEPCEHCTQKCCRILRDSKMLELKVISSRDLKLSSKTFSQRPSGMTGAHQCPTYFHS